MKRFLVLVSLLCLLAGCAAAPVQSFLPAAEPKPPAGRGLLKLRTEDWEPSFVFTRENFPRLDGSTSTVPLAQAVAAVLLGESRETASELIQFSRTTRSYRHLMAGEADLLLAAEPAEAIWTEKAQAGFDWEIAPFAIDGLVFMVNADNPVDSLTADQVRRIYTGEITNWKEVGGEDVPIVPFQRNEEAGSQTAMKKLVMGNLPLMEAPKEYVSSAMGALVEVIASYNDSAAAIGYTVYYYAHDMKMADGLKILAVDGVQPNADTIRSHQYPFINDSYVVIRAGLAPDDPAKVLYDWIMSEEGQALVAHEGYVSVLDVGEGTP